MKKSHPYIIAFIVLTVLNTGCEKYFDLNDNPNLAQDPPFGVRLTTVTHKTGLNSYRIASITNSYVQYIANPSAGGATDTYQITDNTSTWDFVYLAMADIYDLKQKAVEEGASEYSGVANVLMAYNLGFITDMFGDAPYSEAFIGQEILTPGYDDQESLYNETVRLIDEAITELEKTEGTPVLSEDHDLIHGGSREAWLRTAYALKARFLNKVSKKASYDPEAVLEVLVHAYTSNADDAEMGDFEIRNPWATVAVNNAGNLLGGWLSDNLINHLNGTTYGLFDPRIEKITDRTVHDEYVGTPNGGGNQGSAANTVKDECYISLNSPYSDDESPLIMVSYAELKFIEAEAAFRAGDPERAYTAYLDGIRANMEKLDVDPADRDTYIDDPSVSVGSENLTLGLIFKEKYVVTYLNPEAWNDARRHDYQYEDFKMPVGAVMDTFIRRVAYPVGERSKNGENVPAEVPLSSPLWWDQP